MSKSQITKIRTIKMFSFTPTLIFWGCVVVFWTVLTSFVTYMTLQMNFGVPQHACEVSVFVQPMTVVEKVDKHEKALVDKIVDNYNVPQQKAEAIVSTVAANVTKGTFPSAELVLAVIQTESSFKHSSISSAGAKGIMQIMPFNSSGKDLFSNVHDGVKLLRAYHNQLKGNIKATLMAYNAGIGTLVSGKAVNFEYVEKVNRNLKLLKG